jgi:hypothetical protein
VWASALIVIALVAGFFSVLHWYAYSNYFLGDDAGVVAVYQGQPHGVLWYHPVKVLDTTYSARQLRPTDARALAKTISEPSLNSSLHYAAYLHTAWELSRASKLTTTTSTTLSKPTTTTSTTPIKTTTTVKRG